MRDRVRLQAWKHVLVRNVAGGYMRVDGAVDESRAARVELEVSEHVVYGFWVVAVEGYVVL